MQPIRGFRDLISNDFALFSHVVKHCEAAARLYGYEGIEMPLVEEANVFQRTLGESSDIVNKEMFVLHDRNQDLLALRPEGTAGLVRAFLSNKLTQELPQKFFYKGPMFRYERPQKGRYRQFYQFGVEVFGIAEPYIDAEVILMACRLLEQLKVTGYTLDINTIGDSETRRAYNEALVNYLTPYQTALSEDSQKRLIKNPLRILDSKDLKDQEIVKDAPKFSEYLSDASKVFFDKVLRYLDQFNISYKVNPLLVRGLDYYSHTLFEFKHESLGAQDTFLGGGRYDGLVETMGGPATPGVGWALGIDRVMFLTQVEQEEAPVVIVPFDDACMPYALNVLDDLHKAQIKAEISFKGKMAKDLKYAERRKAQYVLLIGEDEMKAQNVTVKTMTQGIANQLVNRAQVTHAVR